MLRGSPQEGTHRPRHETPRRKTLLARLRRRPPVHKSGPRAGMRTEADQQKEAGRGTRSRRRRDVQILRPEMREIPGERSIKRGRANRAVVRVS